MHRRESPTSQPPYQTFLSVTFPLPHQPGRKARWAWPLNPFQHKQSGTMQGRAGVRRREETQCKSRRVVAGLVPMHPPALEPVQPNSANSWHQPRETRLYCPFRPDSAPLGAGVKSGAIPREVAARLHPMEVAGVRVQARAPVQCEAAVQGD